MYHSKQFIVFFFVCCSMLDNVMVDLCPQNRKFHFFFTKDNICYVVSLEPYSNYISFFYCLKLLMFSYYIDLFWVNSFLGLVAASKI